MNRSSLETYFLIKIHFLRHTECSVLPLERPVVECNIDYIMTVAFNNHVAHVNTCSGKNSKCSILSLGLGTKTIII
jgi:hypothetical protein